MRTIGAVRSAEIVALGSASMNSFALILPLTWPASSAEPHSMRLNEASAVFAMPTWEDVFIVPSNLPSIKMLDEDKRVDPNLVTVYQSLRLLTIELSIPFLVMTVLSAQVSSGANTLAVHDGVNFWLVMPFCIIGALVADKIKISTPYLIGPVIVTIIAALSVGRLDSPPEWLMIIAQLSIGIYVGVGLNMEQLKKLVRTLPATMAGIFFILTVSMIYAVGLAHFYDFDLITAFLAMAPGGIAEMCLTGMSVGANVAIILTYQLFRMLFIALVIPVILKKYFGKPDNTAL